MKNITIATIIHELEQFAPTAYQESYDNCGLLTGAAYWECTGILCTLDATEAVVLEAISKGCNLIVAHHPIIFSGLKKLNGKNYIERTIIAAIKNDIAIYAIHTNADNMLHGVNHAIANKLQLVNQQILLPKTNTLAKLITFVPTDYLGSVRQALFNAGAGNIGNYSEASFSSDGIGTYKANDLANPFIGEKNQLHQEPEKRLEIIFPIYLQQGILKALVQAHPYEEVAYDIVPLANANQTIGSGMVGNLSEAIDEVQFLQTLKQSFGLKVIRHTPLLGKKIQRVALCGGAGSFLIKHAIAAHADIYITADIKYHEFFDAEEKLIIADIGHWESEQYTIDILIGLLTFKFPTFGSLKSEVVTNPVQYFV